MSYGEKPDRDATRNFLTWEDIIQQADASQLRKIGTGVAVAIFVMLVLIMVVGRGDSLFAVFCLIVIGVLGTIGGYVALTRYRLAQWFGAPRVDTNAEVLHRGETVSVQYRQMIKRAVQMQAFTATFVLRETATYRRGTDTVTETHDHVLGTYNAPGAQLSPGIELAQAMPFEIPPNAIHTFDGGNNKLQYFVLIDVELPEWPHHYKHRYEILVG